MAHELISDSRIIAPRLWSDEEPMDIRMVYGDAVSNVIDELTRPWLIGHGLAILKVFETANGTDKGIPQKVFHLRQVGRLFHCRAWVHGMSNPCQVLSKILLAVAPNSISNGQNIKEIGTLLSECLKGKKYLIILSGLLESQIWDVLQSYFPDDNVGSRVLLSFVLNPGRSWISSVRHEDTIMVGMDEEMDKIIDELTLTPSKLLMVTISGMGGIGKTTLAKRVFHDNRVTHYFHCAVWVDAKAICCTDQALSLLLSRVSVPKETEGQTIEDKGNLLRRSLKRRRYLIVVDGLWNFEIWDFVQRYFPDDKVGSRILITTCVTEFPMDTCNIPKNPPHCLTSLDRHQSWELLEGLVFRKEKCPSILVTTGKEIAQRCEGLPLAIVVIAGILRNIPCSFISWRSIVHDVTSAVSADQEPCLDILALSYDHLPDQLKPCLLFMGAFPEDCEVGVKYLCNLWIASGLLDSGSYVSSYTEAEKCLNDLIGRNLLIIGRRSLNGEVRTCFIPALVRKLCLREAQKQNFMHVLEAGANAKEVAEGINHLIYNLDHLDDSQLLPPLPHLCSFIWLNHGSDFTPDMLLLQLSVFERLRVLDIYFVPFDTFPSELLNLVNLRYLALNVTYEFDARIAQFSKLQTLVVYGPWVIGEGNASPLICLEFWKMPCLINVYLKVLSSLRYPYLLRPLLDGSPEPSSLQSLSMVTFSSCTKELFLLVPKLKKLGVSETKEDFSELTKCFHSLSFLTELQTLKCSFYKGNGEARNLGLDILPATLKKLTLSGSGLSWDEMKLLALLPKLETLKLKNRAFQGPEWAVTEEVFDSLKHLLIDNTDLVNWEVEDTDRFPRLERLVLRSCLFLEKIPWGVGELSVLQVIELQHCSESAKSSAKEFEEQYGFPKVVCKVSW